METEINMNMVINQLQIIVEYDLLQNRHIAIKTKKLNEKLTNLRK